MSIAALPRDPLAAEIGVVVGTIERELRLQVAAELAELRAVRAEQEMRLRALEEQTAARLAGLRDGEPGPPGETPALDVPDEIAPMVARAIAMLAEAPSLLPPQPLPPVVNVTVPPPRTERSRVTHDAQGRVVAIERDVA